MDSKRRRDRMTCIVDRIPHHQKNENVFQSQIILFFPHTDEKKISFFVYTSRMMTYFHRKSIVQIYGVSLS